jgi:LemA protein
VRTAWIAIPILLAAALGGGSVYVKIRTELVQQRTDINSEWSDVDRALQQRAGLIGDLAEAGRKVAPLQGEILQQIAEARQVIAGGPAPVDKVQANSQLSSALAKVLVESENHPQLQTNSLFLRLEEEIRKSEDRIAEARLKYNDSLEHYNARIQGFPHNLVAKIAGFGRNDAYFPTEHF